jgi:hypothetical protein
VKVFLLRQSCKAPSGLRLKALEGSCNGRIVGDTMEQPAQTCQSSIVAIPSRQVRKEWPGLEGPRLVWISTREGAFDKEEFAASFDFSGHEESPSFALNVPDLYGSGVFGEKEG